MLFVWFFPMVFRLLISCFIAEFFFNYIVKLKKRRRIIFFFVFEFSLNHLICLAFFLFKFFLNINKLIEKKTMLLCENKLNFKLKLKSFRKKRKLYWKDVLLLRRNKNENRHLITKPIDFKIDELSYSAFYLRNIKCTRYFF